MKKLALTPIAVLALVLGAAGTAAAHIPDHGAGCDGITVSGTKYTQGGTVDLTIGTSHAHHTFAGPAFSYSLSNPDRTHTEPWTIVIISNAGDGSATYQGTVQPCAPASTTTSSTSPATTVAPSTTSPAPPSTTTSPPTTVAPATTVGSTPSSPPATATSVPAGSVPSSVTDSSPPPSSATSTSTTEVAVAVAAPPVPPRSTLPATGTDTNTELLVVLALLVAGTTLTVVTRRGRRRSAS